MCKKFLDWAHEIKEYCEMNGLDFEKAQRMSKSCGENDLALQFCDEEKGQNGLLDETPMPVVLWVKKGDNGSLTFEQTEYTEMYLKKVS